MELKKKFDSLIKQSEAINVKKGSIKYFRCIVRTVITTLRLFRESIKNKLNSRQNKILDLQNMLEMYNDIMKGWLMKSIKRPLVSILNDPNLSFDFMDNFLGQE